MSKSRIWLGRSAFVVEGDPEDVVSLLTSNAWLHLHSPDETTIVSRDHIDSVQSYSGDATAAEVEGFIPVRKAAV